MNPSSGTLATHRKLVRHFDEPGQAHELTFSCYRRLPLLETDDRRALLSRSIDSAVCGHGFELIAFIFMPEHVHLIVWPVGDSTISKLLFALKRPFSYRLKQELETRKDPLLDELTIRERPGKTTFRFWQEGGGYDRNIHNGKTLRQAIEYVHNNPVRRGLCPSPGDYRWSSWKYYFEPERWNDRDLPTVHGFVD
ncbi:MAG: transposase [Planctomycetota bacterium]